MRIPYGFCVIEDRICVDKYEGKAVELIFNSFLSGLSLRKISEKLCLNGFKSPSGKPGWTAQTISDILREKKYCDIVSIEKYFDACFEFDRRRFKCAE